MWLKLDCRIIRALVDVTKAARVFRSGTSGETNVLPKDSNRGSMKVGMACKCAADGLDKF